MANGDISLWSTTAASNATADPDINWAEGQAPSTVNNSARTMMSAIAAYRDAQRKTLTADRTYYVRADGIDTATGLTDATGANGAFLTIQKAINTFAARDGGGFAGTIQVRSGTFAGISLTAPFVGFSSVSLVGDTTTPANVIISTSAVNTPAISLSGKCVLRIRGFKLTTSGSGSDGILVVGGASALVDGNMNYGACNQFHLFSYEAGSSILISASYTISGNALRHRSTSVNATMTTFPTGLTITLTGTPAFSSAFVAADRGAVLNDFSETYSGSATGPRYAVQSNAVIYTNGGGANYFPGDSVGTSSSGGIYI